MADALPKILCFTDLKDCSGTDAREGDVSFARYIMDHLRVGEALAQRAGGTAIKNAGDALFVEFAAPQAGLRFATQLQQYYASGADFEGLPVQVRIGLFQGLAVPDRGDFFGSGANLAARVQNAAAPGEVLVNHELFRSLDTLLGHGRAATYLSSIGTRDLKGYGQHELFRLDWPRYAVDHPTETLGGQVRMHLQSSRVVVSRVQDDDLTTPGDVIWPVVPRKLLTAIHRAQAEVIRLLHRLGWRVTLLLSDCGTQQHSEEDRENFCADLDRYAKQRGFAIAEVNSVADLFNPTKDAYLTTQQIFREITTKLTLEALRELNCKTYDDATRQMINKRPTLDCLQPALTVAAAHYLAREGDAKSIVVAGEDELPQWTVGFSLYGRDTPIGLMMIPRLNTKDQRLWRQLPGGPIWHSEGELAVQMQEPNLAWWCFHLHAFLPAFPSAEVAIGEAKIVPQAWDHSTMAVPECIDLDALARHVWTLLSPDL